MRLVEWLENNRDLLVVLIVLLLALVIVQRLYWRVRGVLRRRHPAQINPKLLKYAGQSEVDREADRQAAEKIVATSSTGRIAGYEVVRQIEAVYVEGYRAPDEASAALKTTAGRLGANAIINLSYQRTAGGRCAAQGDAVLVHPRSAAADAKDATDKA